MSETVSDDAPFGANSPFFRIIEEELPAMKPMELYRVALATSAVYTGRPAERMARFRLSTRSSLAAVAALSPAVALVMSVS
jgi:hypothetical protein